MNPLVSIIIPTFNRKEYLKQAIESALQQSYSNLEIVISDDCSTDGTQQLVKGFTETHSKIVYFRNEPNLGFAENHRRAICNYATGDYSFILGDDDYFSNNEFIKIAIDFIVNNNFPIAVGSNYIKLDIKNSLNINTDLKMPTIFDYRYYLNSRISKGKIDLFIGATVFNRKSAISINPFSHKTHAADGEFIDKLTLTGSCGFIPTNSIFYRMHDMNLSGKIYNDWESVNDLYEIPIRTLNMAKELGIDTNQLEEYKIRYLNAISVNYIIHKIRSGGFSLHMLKNVHSQVSAKHPLSFLFWILLLKRLLKMIVKN